MGGIDFKNQERMWSLYSAVNGSSDFRIGFGSTGCAQRIRIEL